MLYILIYRNGIVVKSSTKKFTRISLNNSDCGHSRAAVTSTKNKNILYKSLLSSIIA